MNRFFRYLKWYFGGKPMIKYEGFTCGLCGKHVKEKFEIPEYDSMGKWWDTWWICKECAKRK